MAENMSAAEMVALTRKHTFFSWSAQNAVNPMPMVRGKGVYFWDADGKRYLDFNSQLMCVNIGHGNQRVIDAIKARPTSWSMPARGWPPVCAPRSVRSWPA